MISNSGIPVEMYFDRNDSVYRVAAAGVDIVALPGRSEAAGVYQFLSGLDREPLAALVDHAYQSPYRPAAPRTLTNRPARPRTGQVTR